MSEARTPTSDLLYHLVGQRLYLIGPGSGCDHHVIHRSGIEQIYALAYEPQWAIGVLSDLVVLAECLHTLDDAAGCLGSDVEHACPLIDFMAEPRSPKRQVMGTVEREETLVPQPLGP